MKRIEQFKNIMMHLYLFTAVGVSIGGLIIIPIYSLRKIRNQ